MSEFDVRTKENLIKTIRFGELDILRLDKAEDAECDGCFNIEYDSRLTVPIEYECIDNLILALQKIKEIKGL